MPDPSERLGINRLESEAGADMNSVSATLRGGDKRLFLVGAIAPRIVAITLRRQPIFSCCQARITAWSSNQVFKAMPLCVIGIQPIIKEIIVDIILAIVIGENVFLLQRRQASLYCTGRGKVVFPYKLSTDRLLQLCHRNTRAHCSRKSETDSLSFYKRLPFTGTNILRIIQLYKSA